MSGKVVRKLKEEQPEHSDADNARDALQQPALQQVGNAKVIPAMQANSSGK